MVATACAIIFSPSLLLRSVWGILSYKTDEFLKTWKDQNETYLDISEQLRSKNVNYIESVWQW